MSASHICLLLVSLCAAACASEEGVPGEGLAMSSDLKWEQQDSSPENAFDESSSGETQVPMSAPEQESATSNTHNNINYVFVPYPVHYPVYKYVYVQAQPSQRRSFFAYKKRAQPETLETSSSESAPSFSSRAETFLWRYLRALKRYAIELRFQPTAINYRFGSARRIDNSPATLTYSSSPASVSQYVSVASMLYPRYVQPSTSAYYPTLCNYGQGLHYML